MNENDISYTIVGAALKTHKALGPGLLESVYESVLAYELKKCDLFVERQVSMPLIYENVHLDTGYRLDILVEKLVIVEIKAIEALAPVHFAQTLTYLKLSGHRLALLINFNCNILKGNIHRLVNNL